MQIRPLLSSPGQLRSEARTSQSVLSREIVPCCELIRVDIPVCCVLLTVNC